MAGARHTLVHQTALALPPPALQYTTRQVEGRGAVRMDQLRLGDALLALTANGTLAHLCARCWAGPCCFRLAARLPRLPAAVHTHAG